MSRLREMIKELCPDGVEYRWFEDCCEYVRGITYNKSNEARSDSEPVWRVLRANNITLSSNTLNFDDVKLIEKTVLCQMLWRNIIEKFQAVFVRRLCRASLLSI